MTDFVENWSISHTLGEGAYGEVKLVIHKTSGDCVAMKVIDLTRGGEGLKTSVEKEVRIHKILKNDHIVRCYGSRQQSNFFYIFLEYAPNGELFDRIEPDVGMPVKSAQKFMNQLISGVAYLHSYGIAHRDIKPENLLLDKNDNLKISDFGLATIFKLQGKERPLEKRCGTLPYVAPEVLSRPYAAAPADLWSCGIVLLAMLTGELPWDKPTDECVEYVCWRKGDYMHLAPWSKLDTLALSLIRAILQHLPSARPTSEQISSHRFLSSHKKISGLKRKAPLETVSQTDSPVSPISLNRKSYSQPSAPLHDILLSTQQILATQTTVQNSLQKLVRRMTRFYLSFGPTEASEKLTAALDKLGLSWKQPSNTVVEVSLTDRRQSQLLFKATLFLVEEGCTLVDFRLCKGDGLEFKRNFLAIRNAIKPYIMRPPNLSTSPSIPFLPPSPSP